MSKKLVSIVIVFISCLQLSGLAQEKITVSGSVYDIGTNEPLPFATVAVLGSYLGVATNEDGEFILSLPSIFAYEILEISFVGYSPITLSVEKAMTGPQIIFLKALDVTVGEVLVKSRRISGREILEKSLSRIKANYYQDPYIVEGFYREVASENRKEVAIAEATIEVFKTGYNNYSDREQVRVERSRRINPKSTMARSVFNFEGGTYLRNNDDLIKNRISFLKKEHIPYYKYSISRVLGDGRESVIVLKFIPNSSYINSLEASRLGPTPIFNSASLMYSGEIFINEADNAIIKVEYWLDDDRLGNSGDAYITSLPKGVRYRLNSVRFMAEYREVKGRYSLSYTNGELNFRVRGGPFLVSTEYNVFNEFLILDMQVQNVEKFDPTTVAGYKDIIDDVDTIYDAKYWMNYNIVMASARLRNIGKLSDELLQRDKLEKDLSELWLNNFNERIHIHIDRNRYLSGDIVFFKAYVIEEATGLPSRRSNSFYALLTNNLGELIESARFSLKEGVGVGSFTLPDNMEGGDLNFTAFSSNMQNFGPELAFTQLLRVENKIAFAEQINKGSKLRPKEKAPDLYVPINISILPEGGKLLSGLNNNLGIITQSETGLPLKASVVIRDQDRRILDTVHTGIYGIGEFTFKPESGVAYYAYNAKSTSLLPESVKFPLADDNGLTFKLLESSEDTLRIRVSSNKGFVQDAYLVLTSGMDILGDSHFKIDVVRVIELPYKAVRGGVATLTLYDGKTPVAERLLLLNTDTRAIASAKTEYMAYPANSKMDVSIKVTNKSARPISASVSLAIIDSINAFSANISIKNILYSLWLKPSLQEELPPGLAEFIAAKIENIEIIDHNLLNNFLLCYGWRKIGLISNSLKGRETINLLPKDYDALITELKAKKKKLRRPHGNVSIVDLTNFEIDHLEFDRDRVSVSRIGSGWMKSMLMIGFDDPKDIKNWSLSSRPQTNKDFITSALKITHKKGLFKPPSTVKADPIVFDKDIIIIDEVVVKGRAFAKVETPKLEDRYNFSNATSSYRGTPEEHPGARSLLSLLQEISSPRRIDRSIHVGEVYYREVIKNPLFGGVILPVIFIVDDVPVSTNYHDLDYLPVEQIASLRVVIGPHAFSFFGERAQGGAVLIYTKREFEPRVETTISDPGFITINPLCKVSREFYKPVYDSITIQEASRFRPTIHWEPDLVLGSDGNANITYFNPGYNSSVVGILQGISSEGVPFQTRFRYRVIKD